MIASRVPSKLLQTAKQRPGAKSISELIRNALTKAALKDDFGRRLVARKGRVPSGTLAV